MNSWTRCLPIALALTAASVVSAQEGVAESSSEVRIWTSGVGSTFTGSVGSLEGDHVVLIGTDGRKVKLRREQLSIDDRTYLQNFERQNHAARVEFYRANDFASAHLPEKVLIEDIPHVHQLPNFCVPASAEMLLRFYGYDYDQEYLAQLSSRNSYEGGGTNFTHISQGLRNIGIDSVVLHRRSPNSKRTPLENLMNGIRSSLAEGSPIIISYRNSGLGHAVVAVGYDDRKGAFTVMDPLLGDNPEPLEYRDIYERLSGALAVLPPSRIPAPSDAGAKPTSNAFLSHIHRLTRVANPTALQQFAEALAEDESIPAEFRNANRIDLRTSRGQTNSFARSHGVELIQMALARGNVVVASQTYDEGPGTILIYDVTDDHFLAVEYRPNGAAEKREVQFNDFSIRWPRERNRTYALPLVEIPVPLS